MGVKLIVGNKYMYHGGVDKFRGVEWIYAGKDDLGFHRFKQEGFRGTKLFTNTFVNLLTDVTPMYTAFNPSQHVVTLPAPKIGDKLVLRSDPHYFFAPGDLFEVVDELPDQYVVRYNGTDPYRPARMRDLTVSKIDVWNWFDIWPGSEGMKDPDVEVPRKECSHEFVNVSLFHVVMACKHCGIDESKVPVKAKEDESDSGREL